MSIFITNFLLLFILITLMQIGGIMLKHTNNKENI